MISDIVFKELNAFVQLLPYYLPDNLNNPYDMNRLCKLAYTSHISNCRIDVDDLVPLLSEKFKEWDEKKIERVAKNYLEEYDSFLVLLEYLDKNKLLRH